MLEALVTKLLENVIVTPVSSAFNKIFKRTPKLELKADTVEKKYKYDVFIAAPMESHDTSGKYKKSRVSILDLKAVLINKCEIDTVYYAGENILSKSKFEDESLSLESNLTEIRNSKCFLFIFPEYKPSSTLVEVGMALALGMESIWFFRKGEAKPFVLRDGAAASGRGGLPRITVYEYETFEDILKLMKKKKSGLFETLKDCD